MIHDASVADVSPQESLARFILFSKHVRADRTLKPDAFMPHPYLELSVTRHLSATDEELWAVGKDVANVRSLTLYGRGDVQAATFAEQGLVVSAKPIPTNPNHANVTGWPVDKPAQKNIAQEIAAASRYLAAPVQNAS